MLARVAVSGLMRLALVQMRVEPGDPERNLERAAALVRTAKEKGAELVLLPEALPFGWIHPRKSSPRLFPGEDIMMSLSGWRAGTGFIFAADCPSGTRAGFLMRLF
jgi:hypothetical protein